MNEWIPMCTSFVAFKWCKILAQSHVLKWAHPSLGIYVNYDSTNLMFWFKGLMNETKGKMLD